MEGHKTCQTCGELRPHRKFQRFYQTCTPCLKAMMSKGEIKPDPALAAADALALEDIDRVREELDLPPRRS